MSQKGSRTHFWKKGFSVLSLVTALVCGGQSTGRAQDGTKSVKPEEFTGKRPASTQPAPPSQPAPPPRPDKPPDKPNKPRRSAKTNKTSSSVPSIYVVNTAFPTGPPPVGYEYARLGVTFWRVTPNECPGAVCPVPTGEQKGLFASPVRIEDTTVVPLGSLIRIGIEALSQGGYVYIVDRDQLADGKLDGATMIFPANNVYEGDSFIRPGQLISLPQPGACFCTKPRDPMKKVMADVLTVIISPGPLLSKAEIIESANRFPEKLNAFLNRADLEKSSRASLQGGTSLAPSLRENAVSGGKNLDPTGDALNRSDLPPQNVYQNLIPHGSAALFTFSLRYVAP